MTASESSPTPVPGNLPADPLSTFETLAAARSLTSAPDESDLPTVWTLGGASAGAEGSTVQPYELRHQVGRGGFGEVWEAVQKSLRRTVAVKQMRRDAEGGEDEAELRLLFRHEALTMASLEHPNIVPVYDYGVDESGRPMLSMKLVRGENWSQVIRREFAAMAPADFLAKHLPILADVAQAVAFAHDAGIVHRDLKPAQVMLGGYGEVLLTDWGLAVDVGRPAGGDSPGREAVPAPNRVDASAPAGTPSFMAPEQTLPHARSIGTWTDVYLLGGILYMLLSGSPPHAGGSSNEVYENAARGDVPDVMERAAGRPVPPELARLATHALRPVPEERIPSAAAFLAALRESMSGTARRRESLEVSASVAARMKSGALDYAALTALVNDIERARLLWAENEEAARCREALLSEQARIALREGDLLLAGATIDRLAAAESRAAFGRLLADARLARSKRERERRLLRIATAALLATVLGGGAWFVLRLGRARERAESARSRAENLLGFMIGDLRKRLEPVGRIDVLDAVAEQAGEYLASLPAEDMDDTAWFQRAQMQTQLGALRRDQGKLALALEILVKEAQELEARKPPAGRERDWLAIAAETNAKLGQVRFDAGELDKSAAAYAVARGYYRDLRQREPAEGEWAAGESDSLRGIGESLGMTGKWDDAFRTFSEAYAALPTSASGGLSAADLDRKRAQAKHRIAVSQQSMRDPAARESYTEAVAIMEALVHREPADQSHRNTLVQYLAALGLYIVHFGTPAEAIPHLERALGIARELSAFDPGNMEWQSDLSYIASNYGTALDKVGRHAESIAILTEAMVKQRILLQRNPGHFEWMRDLGTQAHAISRPLLALGRRAEAEAAIVEGGEAMIACLAKDPKLYNQRTIFKGMATQAAALAEAYGAAGDFAAAGRVRAMLLRWEALPYGLPASSTAAWANSLGDISRHAAESADGDAAYLAELLFAFTESLAAVSLRQPTGDITWDLSATGLLQARLAELRGDWDEAANCHDVTDRLLRTMGDSNPFFAHWRTRLIATVHRQQAALAHRAGNAAKAAAEIAEAFALLDHCLTLDVEESSRTREQANRALALVIRGRIRQQAGDTPGAAADWEQAVALCEPHLDAWDPATLRPLCAALSHLGRTSEAKALAAILQESGPLPPEVEAGVE